MQSLWTAERIRALRGERSRAELAALVGVTALTVYRWELPDDAAEARRPRGRVLERLERVATAAAPSVGAQSIHELAPEDEALLLPLLNAGFRTSLPTAEERLIAVLSSGALASHAGRSLATAAIATFRVTTSFDARGAYAALAPVLREADAGALPPIVELYARVAAALVFSSFDGSLFDIGKVNAQIDRGAPIASRLGEDDLHFVLLVGHAAACLQGGSRDWGVGSLRRLAELRDRITGPLTQVLADEMAAYGLVQHSDRSDIVARFEAVSQRAESIGLVTAAVRAGAFALLKGVHQGRPPRELEPGFERVHRLVHRHRLAGGIHTAFLTSAEVEATLRAGTFGRTAETIARGMREAEEMQLAPVPVIGPWLFLRRYLAPGVATLPTLDDLVAALERGRMATAHAVPRFLVAIDRYDASPAATRELTTAAAELVATDPNELARSYLAFAPLEARLFAGDLASFEDDLRAVERPFEAWPLPIGIAKARVLRGLHAAALGRHEEGRQLLAGALSTFTAVEHVPEILHTRVHLARIGVVEGAPRAPEDLEEALVACARIGLLPPPELDVSARRRAPLARERERTSLAAPIERLAGRGVPPRLVLRELARVVEELWPGVAYVVERLESEGAPAALFASEGARPQRPVRWELGDGIGGRYRLTLDDEALPAGAPENVRALVTVASLAIELASLRGAVDPQPAARPARRPASSDVVANSPPMRQLLDEVERLSGSSATVLLSGESGAGKEVVARAIHDASRRRSAPYVTFNCSSVPRDLFEGQLFGYRKGAFTGATADHQGVIRAAHEGTLFLDEIGELPLDVQPKLLRFLENREVLPLGDARPTLVDVRLVAATHRDLAELVRERRFREDLYYRLNVVPLRVPPLRERPEDVAPLVRHFLERFVPDVSARPVLSPSALGALLRRGWPGNVRELKNAVERIVAFSPIPRVLKEEHFG